MTAFFGVHLVLTIVSLILDTIIGIRALRVVAGPVGSQPSQDDQLSPF
jgi:hypothetical protein